MKGIMVLAHGSRVKETTDTIEKIVKLAKDNSEDKDMPIEIAYMELCQPDIPTVVKKLVDMGVDEIKVVPYFLFRGIHIKKDIPNELEAALEGHDNVKITMGDTLGADPRLAEILADRIND